MSVCVSFTIPGQDASKLKEKIQHVALQQGQSMSEFIVEAVVEAIRKLKKKAA